MKQAVASFAHCGQIVGRPPAETYERESDYLHARAQDFWFAGHDSYGDHLARLADRFEATARKLHWQASARHDPAEEAA